MMLLNVDRCAYSYRDCKGNSFRIYIECDYIKYDYAIDMETSVMNDTLFRIGEVSKQANVSIQTLRYYEREGLIEPNARTASGYRLYGKATFRELGFIQHLKLLGFSLKEIKEIKILSVQKSTRTKDIKDRAIIKLNEINDKISSLSYIREKLEVLVERCPGNHSPIECCPILKTSDSLPEYLR